MTPRQTKFVQIYLLTLNAASAARAAGYSKSSSAKQGARLLKTPEIRRVVDEAAKARAASAEVEQTEVLRELRTIYLASIDDFELGDDRRIRVRPGVPPSAIKAIASAKFHREYSYDGKLRSETAHVSLWDKGKAIVTALRFLGLLKDKLEVDVRGEFQKEIEESAAEFDQKISAIVSRLHERPTKH